VGRGAALQFRAAGKIRALTTRQQIWFHCIFAVDLLRAGGSTKVNLTRHGRTESVREQQGRAIRVRMRGQQGVAHLVGGPLTAGPARRWLACGVCLSWPGAAEPPGFRVTLGAIAARAASPARARRPDAVFSLAAQAAPASCGTGAAADWPGLRWAWRAQIIYRILRPFIHSCRAAAKRARGSKVQELQSAAVEGSPLQWPIFNERVNSKHQADRCRSVVLGRVRALRVWCIESPGMRAQTRTYAPRQYAHYIRSAAILHPPGSRAHGGSPARVPTALGVQTQTAAKVPQQMAPGLRASAGSGATPSQTAFEGFGSGQQKIFLQGWARLAPHTLPCVTAVLILAAGGNAPGPDGCS